MGIKHYYDKTPKKWRKIGDTILVGSGSLSLMVMNLPITDNQKVWANTVINLLGIGGKLLTNFFKEDDSFPVDANAPPAP